MNVKARKSTFRTRDGVTISAQEWGRSNGPAIVFIHGFSQCHLSWSHQVSSELAERFRLYTYDLRGHGESAKPLSAEYYQDSARWADELEGVLDHFALERVVVVAWSYAGRIVSDYLQQFGSGRIEAINLVGSKTRSDPAFVGPGIRELQSDMISCEVDRNVLGTIAFLEACAERWDEQEFVRHIAFNMIVPPKVRGFMMGRSFDADDIYKRLHQPVLLTHGSHDRVVPVIAAERSLALLRRGRLSVYDGVGHAPFLEAPERFNSELADLAATV